MQKHEVFGVLAEFPSPQALCDAAKKVRDKGFTQWDTHSPFPIHGMDGYMGMKPSKLGWIVLVCAILGVSGGFLLQWWTSAVDYPLIIAGKPYNSYQLWVPITFELGILLSAFGAIFGMLVLNRLPAWYHPLFKSKHFHKVTDDGFFLHIQARDTQYDAVRTPEFLQQIGGINIEILED